MCPQCAPGVSMLAIKCQSGGLRAGHLTPRTEGQKSSQLRACFPCECSVCRRAVCYVRGMACGPQMVPEKVCWICLVDALASRLLGGAESAKATAYGSGLSGC
jgi:hypothetical protein